MNILHSQEFNKYSANILLRQVPRTVVDFVQKVNVCLPDTHGLRVEDITGLEGKEVMISEAPRETGSPGVNGQRIGWTRTGDTLIIYPNPRDLYVAHTTHENGESQFP